ncbi:MAG: TIGR03905 family TSCPD domain-containing protein [Clostridia bacterium]|nr:TIGR03905 family TSCPD domain-containing protein [Clostridia bacterium]
MTHSYKTRGTCSRQIDFELDNGIVKNVSFYGGCNGNLKGIGALVEGRPAEEVIELLKGMKCGFKPTSCPDQLALALEKALDEESK